MSQPTHIPVLLPESLELLAPRPGGIYVDATLGLGGHAEAILEASAPDGRLLGIDRDPEALALAASRLRRFGDRAILRQGRFSDLPEILGALGMTTPLEGGGSGGAGFGEKGSGGAGSGGDPAKASRWGDMALSLSGVPASAPGAGPLDGLIADLGVSSLQLDDPGRGFSFREPGPLDMRMDPQDGITAEELLADLSVEELADILRRYGEQPRARAVARAMKAYLHGASSPDTSGLARAVAGVLPPKKRGGIHPATQAFMAIRIALNEELAELEALLNGLPDLLGPEGRAVMITFHSLEDRLVKRRFASLCRVGADLPEGLPVTLAEQGEAPCALLTRGAVTPGEAEKESNPRARSARLRAIRRKPGVGGQA